MLQKRLDYGCNGYHVPFVPRAARSTRRRRSVQKKVGEIPLCAFDLLATVAGEILLESENDHNTTLGTDYINVPDVVMDKDDKGDLSLVVENCGQARMETASPHLTLELGIRGLDQDLNVKGIPESLPDCLKKNGSLSKIDLNGDSCCHSGEIEGLSLGLIDTRLPFVVEDAKHGVGEGERLFVNGNDLHSIEDPEVFDGKSPSAVSSDGSVKLTLGIDHYPCSSQLPSRVNNVNLVSRDDDENSSECIQPSTTKTVRSPACIGDRRIRKLLESKYRRMASRARDGDVTDTEVRCLYRSRKMGYKRLRSQRIYPLKKRRFSHYSSFANSHADIGYKGVCNYPDKVVDANASGFGSVGVNGSSVAGQNKSFSSRESQVKLRIKSFRVPELFIEMPETATVGSLKRTVMEAVSALLGGGLRVGVLLQEKKIRDDNKTLIQSGICHNNKVESLGFSLEPNPSPVGASVCAKEENSLLLSIDAPQPISRCPIATSIQQGTSHLSADHLVANLGNFIESDNDSAPSPADLSAGKGMVESHALAALPNGTPQALAVGHSHHKSKSSDMGQRRIRRPFSVSEVEALVQAVEKLGTGRWRDVKLRAFDNVKHRTYVDLKDKWKTLVHTARIAPQQRRGEPVPQVLLDRVLAAHAYWTQVTQHQSNQELVPPSETGLLP